ncbi:hypothetical protein [Limobrevibacterium gyesilva]|uniref:Uncharacterized protein n=1 Tax=Limobrevibacterium gyesilva TaxID=2991712 RepID=A0AA42CK25_9PROT|nr:hypothetical protein [Limobrevibacterium gyesilva]MCW3477425.1 hypothetical protein [Limobrevibacterium gyesilva]
MFSPPAIIVHGLDHARTALRPGLPVTLLSAPGAALYAGCGWWRALVAAARMEFPGTQGTDLLDCGDAPGRAMAALRIGQRGLILDPACPAFPAVAAAAGTLGATVLPHRPASLDLAQPGAARLLSVWLRGDNNVRLG